MKLPIKLLFFLFTFLVFTIACATTKNTKIKGFIVKNKHIVRDSSGQCIFSGETAEFELWHFENDTWVLKIKAKGVILPQMKGREFTSYDLGNLDYQTSTTLNFNTYDNSYIKFNRVDSTLTVLKGSVVTKIF